MYKSVGMKRDRLVDSNSPPPAGSMSKRSRSSGGGGGGSLGRYNNNSNNNNDNDSSDDNSPPPPDSRSSRSDHRHHGGGGGGSGRNNSSRSSSSRNISPRNQRNYNDDYNRSSYKDTTRHSSVSSAPLLQQQQQLPPSSVGGNSSNPYQYKVLCISNLHAKASDEVIRDTLYREFKRFGNISVKVVHEPDERLAFVYFRSAEDAREAKHSKSRIIIYDTPVVVEAAYESAPSYNNQNNQNNNNRTHSSPPPTKSHHHHQNNNQQHHHHQDHYNNDKIYRTARSPVYNDRGGPRDQDHHNNRYNNNDRYDRSMAPPLGPPPQQMHYNNNRGGGGDYRNNNRDHQMHHNNDYNNRPPPNNMHYSRYPPGSSSSGLPPPRHHPSSSSSSSMLPPPHGLDLPPGPPHHHQSNIRGGDMGPPMGVTGPGGQQQQQQQPGGGRSYENKKDKFPNYLHHVLPEDDPLATRTLFAGNLEVNITDEELRRIFGRYGTVEDIDIKRPPPGTGNAYAFVRYVNLDMAARAKSELSGQYIGKFQCKIGYGKVNATTKIWIGGLGPWTTLSMLEREFDRFGSIKKIDWIKGEQFAYITYETIDAAQAAVKDMRGYPLGGTDKRLRTDFADASAPPITPITPTGSFPTTTTGGGKRGGEFNYGEGGDSTDFDYKNNYRNRNFNNRNNNREDQVGEVVVRGGGGPGSTHSGGTDLGTSPGGSDSESINNTTDRPPRTNTAGGGGLLSAARNITDISLRASVGWQGALILKNSSFPTRLYLTEGELEGVDLLMKDEEGKCQLRITQRLRLDQTKLDDVMKRIQTSSAHGIFLSLPTSSTNLLSSVNSSPTTNTVGGGENENGTSGSVQSRPLRNLVSYLKQKDAAGVISLVNAKDSTLTGVLYAFPPCPFSWDLLKKNCPNIIIDNSNDATSKEDHLVIVVIRGGTA